MTAERDNVAHEEAIRWHLRIADGTVDDWEAFTAWLNADQTNSIAYDALEAADAEAGSIAAFVPRARPAAVNDDTPNLTRRWWLGGVAAAGASLAIAVLAGSGLLDRSATYSIITAAGERKLVTLPSGDRIALNGSSQLTLDHQNPRYAALTEGEATFSVRHDPKAPFVLHIGNDRIEDVGTIFDAIHDKNGTYVAVGEGKILYNPDTQAVTLTAGQTLHDPANSNVIVRGEVAPSSVGAWRLGRLSYSQAPFSRVAADITRAIGQPVTLDPSLGQRRFTGTIHIESDHSLLFDDVGILLDVRTVRTKEGWRLAPRTHAAK